MFFSRSIRVPDDVCRCAIMHKNNGFTIFAYHLHHILDPILSLFCNVKLCQRDNFGPQYAEKYVPHLFHFLDNDYLDDKLCHLNFSLHKHFKKDKSIYKTQVVIDYFFFNFLVYNFWQLTKILLSANKCHSILIETSFLRFFSECKT